jgi:ATP-dependent RNA helicase RhlE
MKTFLELSLSPVLQGNLASAKMTIPTPVQAAAIPPALAGRDVLATAQTGTGKTLAFLVPVIEKLSGSRTPGIQALVLVPTRELAMQIVDAFTLLKRRTGIECALVVGGLSESPQLTAIRRGAKLVVATPGRLEDFLDRKLVRLDGVEILVLDESDRMLDMGFLPAIRRILKVLPAKRQTLCFSATLEASTAPFIRDALRDPVRVEIGSTRQPIDRVRLQWFEVASEQKTDLLHDLLGQETGTFLVFARTKHGTERLANRLTRAGHDAAMIHGDRSQSQRTAALRGFQNGTYRVLVATDIAARGVHVDNIAHVVNYDLPQVPEDFIHRVGRTGRASALGVASTFATRQESGEIRKLERALKLKMERLPVDLR